LGIESVKDQRLREGLREKSVNRQGKKCLEEREGTKKAREGSREILREREKDILEYREGKRDIGR